MLIPLPILFVCCPGTLKNTLICLATSYVYDIINIAIMPWHDINGY